MKKIKQVYGERRVLIYELLEKDLVTTQIEQAEFYPKVGTYHVSIISSTGIDSLNRILYERKFIRNAIKQNDYKSLVEFYTEPQRLEMMKYAIRGTNIHNFIEKALQSKTDSLLMEQRKSVRIQSKFVKGSQFIITGKYDIYDKTEKCIYELKSITGGGFRFELEKGARPHHVIQANANAFINTIPKFKVVYINCETLETIVFPGETKSELFTEMVRAADMIFHAEVNNRDEIDTSLLRIPYEKPEIIS